MKPLLLGLTLAVLAFPGGAAARQMDAATAERQCARDGWEALTLQAGGRRRAILWKAPLKKWTYGAIVVLHGGGGRHSDFCAGGALVKPQIEFAHQAVMQGFAVFLIDATDDVVTDAAGRPCGRRFDFSVLDRPNVDLPLLDEVLTRVIPRLRPRRSATKIFLTGLSTGGYMTIRAATHFDDRITAFAPISAGDPYGTETLCDPSLSPRKSAKGVLVDAETRKNITVNGACASKSETNEKVWETRSPARKPAFMQFHDEGDGIVDLSCMQKAQRLLTQQGYTDAGAFLLHSGKRNVINHLWRQRYNQPLLDFFKSQP